MKTIRKVEPFTTQSQFTSSAIAHQRCRRVPCGWLKLKCDSCRLNPGLPLPRPQFTAREISRLELQIIKENDPALREQYAKFYHEALEEPRQEFSRAITLDPSETREILDLKHEAPFIRGADRQPEMSLER